MRKGAMMKEIESTEQAAGAPPLAERLQWFLDARFGIFVHWGCYAVAGRGEQIMMRDMVPQQEYEKLAQRFHPDPQWADRLCAAAAAAGARYIVLTTRHHDGYCLWDTATHDFNAAKTGPGRDLIAEYVTAARKHGLRIGFYYSVHTWRWHGFFNPEGYPEDLPAMVEEMHAQVMELMSDYGRIDILWYDVPAPPGGRVPGNSSWQGHPIEGTPAEFYRSAEINTRVRALQPHILINNRSGIPEDYGTPEQHVTPADGGRAWEACMTLNYAPGWGWIEHPVAVKTHGQILWNMVDAVAKGGNFLFNIGPRPDGSIAGRDQAFMSELGRWLRLHGEAIFGTRPGKIYERKQGQGACYHYGMFTERDRVAYLALFYYPPGGDIIISRIKGAIQSAELLTTGEELQVEAISNNRTRISGLPELPPDPLAAVLKLVFDQPPARAGISNADWLDGKATLTEP